MATTLKDLRQLVPLTATELGRRTGLGRFRIWQLESGDATPTEAEQAVIETTLREAAEERAAALIAAMGFQELGANG